MRLNFFVIILILIFITPVQPQGLNGSSLNASHAVDMGDINKTLQINETNTISKARLGQAGLPESATNGTATVSRDSNDIRKNESKDLQGKPYVQPPAGATGTASNISTNRTAKPFIQLKQIEVDNTVYAIKPANGFWFILNPNNMQGVKGYRSNIGDQVIYRIVVANRDSNNSLRDILILDTLPEGMNYGNSSRIFKKLSKDGILTKDQEVDRMIPPHNISAKITWNIDEIKSNTEVIIDLTAIILDNKYRNYENKVQVVGTWDTKSALIEDKSREVSVVI